MVSQRNPSDKSPALTTQYRYGPDTSSAFGNRPDTRQCSGRNVEVDVQRIVPEQAHRHRLNASDGYLVGRSEHQQEFSRADNGFRALTWGRHRQHRQADVW